MKTQAELKREKRSPFPQAIGILLVLLSGSAIYGWLVHIPFLIRPVDTFEPIKFNAAVLMLMSGLYLMRLRGVHRFIAIPLCLGIIILSGLNVFQYLTHYSFGIDELFVNNFFKDTAIYPGRMAPDVAVYYLEIGIVFLLLRLKQNNFFTASILLILCSLIFGLGAISLIGALGGGDYSYWWVDNVPMSPQSALAVVLASFGLLAMAYEKARPLMKEDPKRFFPIGIALAVIAVDISASQVALRNEKVIAEEKIQTQADSYKVQIQHTLKERMLSFTRMGDRWNSEGGISEKNWRADAANYHRDFEGLLAVSIIGRDHKIKWSMPLEAEAKLRGLNFDKDPLRLAALNDAIAKNRTVLSEALDLRLGNKGFLFLTPLHRNGTLDGFVVAGSSYGDFLKFVREVPGYDIRVTDSDVEVFKEANLPESYSKRWEKYSLLNLDGIDWKIFVTPKVENLEDMTTILPVLILIVGVIISIFITMLGFSYFNFVGANKKIEELYRWQSATVDGSPLAIVATNSRGLIQTFNPAAEKMLGYTAEEVVGIHGPSLWHLPEEVVSKAAELTKELGFLVEPGDKSFTAKADLGIKNTTEWTLVAKDGRKFPANISLHAMKGPDGKNEGYVGILEDITDHKRNEEAMRTALFNAEAGTRAKSQFLATMSHEIRTPINGIVGMVGLILDTQLTAEQRDRIEAISHSADALLSIINDILDFSKIEAGKIELENVQFEMGKILDDSVRLVTVAAEKKEILLQVKIQNDARGSFTGDPGRIQQILLNFLSNAVKFTPVRGTVTLMAAAGNVENGLASIHLEVEDTGIGINEVGLNRLFRSFSQVDASTTRKFGGTGLGLSISKNLAELMGGKIGVDSREGSGTRFWVDIKLRPSKMAAVIPMAVPNTTGGLKTMRTARILIAEDNAINQKVATSMLAKLGYQSDVAANGVEVLTALEKGGYDLILMDCQMPEMDGFEATRKIRESKSQNWHTIPIVAMTANALVGDKEICLEAGMDDYLSKPVKREKLFQVIEHYLGLAAEKRLKA